MQIAHLVATRATCPKRSVGAILVKDRKILTTGYNGAPKGMSHCPIDGEKYDWPVGCLRDSHCIRSLHAEQNALLQAAQMGVACQGSTMYVTCQPCNACAKMIVNAGVAKVIYEGGYPDSFSLDIFAECKVELFQFVSDQLLPVTGGH